MLRGSQGWAESAPPLREKLMQSKPSKAAQIKTKKEGWGAGGGGKKTPAPSIPPLPLLQGNKLKTKRNNPPPFPPDLCQIPSVCLFVCFSFSSSLQQSAPLGRDSPPLYPPSFLSALLLPPLRFPKWEERSGIHISFAGFTTQK